MTTTIEKNKQISITSFVDNAFFQRIFTTHKFFEGFVEMIDNSIDAEASVVSINYDRENNILTFKDNGHGYIPELVYQSLSFGGNIERKNDAIGYNNCGSNATPYYLIDETKTSAIVEKIESNHNGTKVIIERMIEIFNKEVSKQNLDNRVTFLDTYDENGTTITFKGFICSETEYEQVRELINARYYKKIANKKLKLYFDNQLQYGIDMFYRDNIKDKIEASVLCEDEKGTFEVKILMVNTASYLKGKNRNGNSSFNDNLLNDIDRKQHGKSSSTRYNGVYICHNDIYVTLGGEDSFMHLNRVKHQYLNNYRIEINIPIDRKHNIDGIIKTATKKYLSDITYNSKKVYENLFKWWKQASPSSAKRKETKEDLKKKVNNSFYTSREWFSEKIKNVDVTTCNDDVKEILARLTDCINGKKFKDIA